MSTNLKVSGIVVFGVLLSIALPQIITLSTQKHLAEKRETNAKEIIQSMSNSIALTEKKDTAVPVVKSESVVEQPQETQIEEQAPQTPQVQEEAPIQKTPVLTKSYDELTNEELIEAIASGAYKLEYSSSYNASSNRFSKTRGAIYYENHKETYYSERVLPGTSLNIPGRHIAEDGTVRDGDGYICVAANSGYLSKGTVVKTSMGPAKVYDSGCAAGIIDIYTNW